MTVFKNYFKIVKKHLGFIIMFSSIAIGISVANTSYNTSSSQYSKVTSNVAIINNDSGVLVDDFIKYIKTETNEKKVKNNEKEIQDALYNNKVDAILIIPSTFTSDLLNGQEPKIEIKKSAQNMSTTIELMTNKYFKIANIYTSLGMSEEETINKIGKDLKQEIKVKMSSKSKYDSLMKLTIYYSYENYAFLSIFIFIIGTIMCIFNKETIVRRNSISKMKKSKISSQLFFGHLCLTLAIWSIFSIISFIIYGDLMASKYGCLFMLNSFIFAITITSFAFLIGNLVKNQNVISGIQNTFGLGLSFISGCFVGPELLDPNILNFSKIFPSYWYINNNYEIAKLTEFTSDALMPIYKQLGILIIFGVAYFIVSGIVIKRKSSK